MMSLSRFFFLVASISFFIPNTVWARSGYVSGTIKHFNHLGNYCDPLPYEYIPVDCTGAKYLVTEYNKVIPIRHAEVSVVAVINQGSNESVFSLGEGSTDSQGNYIIGWYTNSAIDMILKSLNATYQLRWKPKHKDGRFSIVSPTGGQWFLWGSISSLVNGTTAAAPQSLGVKQWGSSASPNSISNLYDGARRMWDHLSVSNRMHIYFTDFEIMAFQSCRSDRLSSCLHANSKKISISGDAAVWQMSTILHEMGHGVSYIASRDQNVTTCRDYSYGGDTSNIHGLRTPEYACVQFEEGFADFLAITALYTSTALVPNYCLGPGPCGVQPFENIEPSSGALGNCNSAGEEYRWEISTAKFLWDLYDAQIDYPGETFQYPIWTFIDTIHSFDNGTGNRQKNEPWNNNLTALDDRDGRSTYDYRMLYEYYHNISSLQTLYSANCSPAGN